MKSPTARRSLSLHPVLPVLPVLLALLAVPLVGCGDAADPQMPPIVLRLALGAEQPTLVEFHEGAGSADVAAGAQAGLVQAGLVQVLSVSPGNIRLKTDNLRPRPIPGGAITLRLVEGSVRAGMVLLSRPVGGKSWTPFISLVQNNGRVETRAVFASTRIDTVEDLITLGDGQATYRTPGVPSEEYLLLPVPLWDPALLSGQHFKYRIEITR